jgi:hypothetical protein
MKRFVGVALMVAVWVPLAANEAAAASKKKKKTPQVAGFVQTAPVVGGTLKVAPKFGETKVGGYTDKTQQFFAGLANR